MKERIINNKIFFLILLFGATYCFLATPSFFLKSSYFQEYGYFKNAYAFEQSLILVLCYLSLFVINFFAKTKSLILIPKIKNAFFVNATFYFYCLVYVFSCIDFVFRNNYFLYFEKEFLQALSEIGYLVANSNSKFSFTFLYLSGFIFYFFLIREERKTKRAISFFILLFSFFLMFLSGRKEQTIASFCILFFFLSKRFNLNYKLFLILSLLLIVSISLFLNSVRGSSVDSLVNLMFFSQESYPVILGTYLPLMGGDMYYLAWIMSLVFYPRHSHFFLHLVKMQVLI